MGSLALVLHAHGLIDVAHDLPLVLIRDLHEALLGRDALAELLEELGAVPVEGEERLTDLRGELGFRL
jgi:hypothetical protein